MIDGTVRAAPRMGTVVVIRVPGSPRGEAERGARECALGRAFDWFARVEEACSRFEPASEVRRLAGR